MKTCNVLFRIFLILAIVSVTYCPVVLASESHLGRPTPGNTFIDALIYRPVGLVAIPLGAVLFVVSLPFSATGGNISESFSNLIVAPAKYTFHRPLGEI